jgi:signal transduction histidine kinase
MSAERSGAQALAKEEVLSRLSHELRTPLNSVIGFSRVLTTNRAGNQSARDLVMLECIRANGERLLDLVEDLFDVTGRSLEHPPALLPVNVVAAAEVAIAHSLSSARAKDIGLELRVEADTDGLSSLDAARLVRVLRKLIGNAVKFTVRGGVVVTVRVDAGRPTAIEIRDTGIGIPPALQASVFEPFVQGDVGTSRTHEGAGLGLPVARGLAESMSCRLDMKSEPGVGSQFTLVLPG